MEYNTTRRTIGIEEHRRTLAELGEAYALVDKLRRAGSGEAEAIKGYIKTLETLTERGSNMMQIASDRERERDEARQEVEDLLHRRKEAQESWLRAEQEWIISGALQDRKIEKLTTRVLELEQEIVDLGVAPSTGGIDWWKEESKRNQASLDVVRREKVRELAALDRKVERLEAEVDESKLWRALVEDYKKENNRLYARQAGLVAEVSGLKAQLRQARSKSVGIPY